MHVDTHTQTRAISLVRKRKEKNETRVRDTPVRERGKIKADREEAGFHVCTFREGKKRTRINTVCSFCALPKCDPQRKSANARAFGKTTFADERVSPVLDTSDALP